MLNFVTLYWPQGFKKKKKDTIELGKPICNPWGPNNKPKNAQSWHQVFSAVTPSV
jgi:hypothetical protein